MTSAPKPAPKPAPIATVTVGEAMRVTTARLKEAGIDNPRLDARVLLAHGMGLDDSRALFGHEDRAVSPEARATLEKALARRLAGDPVSRILGRREFWSLEFELGADTLDPRPDSETLVEAVLAELKGERAPSAGGLDILDLGTGTGCLLLALLSELPESRGVGVDIAPGAVAVARRNAERLEMAGRADFRIGDWDRGLARKFDIVISNPPYIAEGEIDGLAVEVSRFDPRRALSGGTDGLDAYRILAARLADLLNPGGFAALEIGSGQAGDVARILNAGGLAVARVVRDLAGHDRCLIARPIGGQVEGAVASSTEGADVGASDGGTERNK